jgi:phage gp36-like protein
VAYCTKEQVREALARGTTTDEQADTGASLPDSTINDNISQADTEIDARLGGIYAVPFTAPVPPMIVGISVAIAAYLTDLTFREVRDYSNPDGNPVVLRYRRAQELLKALSNGQADLPGVAPSTTPSAEGQVVAAIGDGALFLPGYDTDLGPYRNPNRSAQPTPWCWW